MFYENLLRPLLFSFPAETAHGMGRRALNVEALWRHLGGGRAAGDPRLRTRLGGATFPNPIGLSAGFDKDAASLDGLQHLGFGYITVGSILPERREGNPRPRLLRLKDEESLLNCYGLPSEGLEPCAVRLEQHARTRRTVTPVVANIDAPSMDAYLASHARLEPFVAAVELGLQCPNNRDDAGGMHVPAAFDSLLRAICAHRKKPLFVKFGFYQSEADRQNRLELVEIAIRHGVDAVVVPGIWKVDDPRLSLGIGATSGRITFARNLEVVRDLAAVARGRIAIKSNGGVFTGQDAFAAFCAGASAVDVLSAFVYRGWQAASLITAELLEIFEEKGIASMEQLRHDLGHPA